MTLYLRETLKDFGYQQTKILECEAADRDLRQAF